MKIFLDTAHVPTIAHWAGLGIVDGVTTNPTHLSIEQSKHPKEIILEICKLLPNGEISVQVTETEPNNVYKQAQAIAKLASNIVVKIPCDVRYYETIGKLVTEGIPLNITLVFTLMQGLMMSKLGVRYISPFMGRWDDIDVTGITVVQALRTMMDTYNFSTQVLAASIRSVSNFHEAVAAGADAVTVPIPVLEKSVHHPLTQQGIEQFMHDWKKLGITKFP